ncbi:MAG: tRNA-dihydrouridine synthase family protein, partial [Clostridia bacterium]|nr:tRNA-dihydrouridine synthase family protein [Clostridia bacterium]
MRIGSIELSEGAGLAPMAGVTDMPMRLLCFEQGAAWAVSEMLSAKGFLCAPKGTRAMRELLRKSEQEGVLGLQLFGREPEEMREAANQLSDAGFRFIDINMGCPAHKIVSNGEGSALMKEPDKAERIIAETVKGARLPVT